MSRCVSGRPYKGNKVGEGGATSRGICIACFPPALHLPPRTYPYNGEEEEDKKGGWLEAFIANQHMHEVGAEHPHKISPQ